MYIKYGYSKRFSRLIAMMNTRLTSKKHILQFQLSVLKLEENSTGVKVKNLEPCAQCHGVHFLCTINASFIYSHRVRSYYTILLEA